MATATETIGHVVQISGPAVDCQFPEGQIPEVHTAIRIVSDGFDVPTPIDVVWSNISSATDNTGALAVKSSRRMREPVTVTSSRPWSCAKAGVVGPTASADARMMPPEAEARLDLMRWRCLRRLAAASACTVSSTADDDAL